MGKSVEDGANSRACTECTRVCQTTHGKGLPRSVPKFFKTIPGHSTPSCKDSILQIPAPYIREHIGCDIKEKYILEGVMGSEWVVTFNNVGLQNGWRTFATDHQLETGDQVMLALVAPKRFYVDVFDKFGMEKFSTRQPVTPRGSPSTVIYKATELGPRNENKVSNSNSGADGAPKHTPTQALKPNGVCAQTSGQNGNHDEKLSPLSRKRAMIEKHQLPHEPLEDYEAEPPSPSQSSEASDDSVQVRLAKAVLVKAKQKKLKRRKTSCTSTPQVEAVAEATKSEGAPQVEAVAEAIKSEGAPQVEAVAEATKSGGAPQVEAVAEATHSEDALAAEEPEVSKSLQNGGGAKEITRMSIEDRISKGVAILSSYVDPAGSSRDDVDETMFEKPCEEPGVGVSNDDEVTPDVSHGRSEPDDLSNGVTDQPGEAIVQAIPPPDQRQNEALGETETATRATGEDAAVRGLEIRQTGELQPSPVFQPGLVKLEPGLRVAGLHSHQSCTKCTNCGLRKEPIQPRNLKSEPVTSESPETPEVRSPSSNAPSSSRDGRVTENQKQRAQRAAKDFSASITNPSGVVVMRISLIDNSCSCFVSVQCAEMLPPEPTELILEDAKGLTHKASWDADLRYIQGQGWRDFVDSHNLGVDDVCVMEVTENSEQQCVVLIHIFHAHEMENLPARASPGVVTDHARAFPAGAKTRSSNLLHSLTPSPMNKRPIVDEAVRTELPRPRASADDPRAATEAPEPSTTRKPRRTTSSSPSTPGRARAAVPPSSTNKRTKAPIVDGALRTELPRAPTYTANARPDTELPGPSTMTRPRRHSSSPLKLATARASVPTSGTGDEPPRAAVREQNKPGKRAKQKAVRRRHSLYTPHLQKKVVVKAEPRTSPRKASKVTMRQHRSTDESEKQVRTRNSRKLHYPVAKLIDRRKSVHGVAFLVELEEPVSQSDIHRRMKACQQDEKGRWWVPHHHFNKDLSSCFID